MLKKKKLTFIPLFYRDWSVVYCQICWLQLTDEFYRQWHWRFSDVCYLWDGKKVAVYRDKGEQAQGMAINILKLIDRDKNFVRKLSGDVLLETKRVSIFFKNILKCDFEKMSGKQLIKEFQKHIKISARMAPKMLITQHLPVYLENTDFMDKYQEEMDLCVKTRSKWDKIVAPLSDSASVKFAIHALGLVGLKKEYGKFISIEEIMNIFSGKVSKSFIKMLEINLQERKKYFLIAGGRFRKQSLRAYLEKKSWELEEEMTPSNASTIKGSITFLSKKIIQGTVVIVNNKDELQKVRRGDIMVSPSTIPEYAPVFGKVAAIITDEGGITSHAAIVSRELKIPAIIGTKIATKVLKDGDMVEVDAEKGIVRIIKNNTGQKG